LPIRALFFVHCKKINKKGLEANFKVYFFVFFMIENNENNISLLAKLLDTIVSAE